MDEDLYDEFGNILGKDPFDSETEDFNQTENSSQLNEAERFLSDEDHNETVSAKGYSNFGFNEDVEVLIETEDRQKLSNSLVTTEISDNSNNKNLSSINKNIPKSTYSRKYMIELSKIPGRVRNISVIGPLHSGKTSLVDLLVLESHKKMSFLTNNIKLGWKQLKYLDNTTQEAERGISIRTNGISLLLTDLGDKSTVCNFLDTPGHVNFMDQVAMSLNATEYALVCVDVVEGVTSITEELIKQCEEQKIEMIFVLNKIDRLILELKLPPTDAYLKLKQIVDELNRFTNKAVSPIHNNIIFASPKLGFTFTIKEYVGHFYSENLDREEEHAFVQKLWGEFYFSEGKISKQNTNPIGNVTFVEFILLPLYKLFIHTLSSSRDTLFKLLHNHYRLKMPASVMEYDPQPLLKHILQCIFKSQKGLADAITTKQSPIQLSEEKLKIIVNNKTDLKFGSDEVLAQCLNIIDIDGKEWSFVKVYKGSIEVGKRFYLIDTSDLVNQPAISVTQKGLQEYPFVEVKEMSLLGGRYLLPITEAVEGQLVLIHGFSDHYSKSSTLYLGHSSEVPLFRLPNLINEPVFKVFIEPMHPRDLPKLIDGLNKVNKYYPGIKITSEKAGIYTIYGFGELYLDCFMYSLRNEYAKCAINISNPSTLFTESCSQESFASIPVSSDDGNISISISSQPLGFKLLKDLTNSTIPDEISSDLKQLSGLLREHYDWDILASNNIWGLNLYNAFINDTLSNEVDGELLSTYKKQILQGFQWAINEGPLAEERIHGVQFRLLNFSINNSDDDSIGNKLISLVRKACYVGIMTASPTLLEPVYEVDIVVYKALLPIVEELLKRRRGGRIYGSSNIGGTPLMEIRAQLPVIESIGFETDLRLSTNGKAMCQLHFWNKIWKKVPGNVLDETATIPKLKPAPYDSLSRDFVMKTRRRKGISEGGFMSNDGPTLRKYIDDQLFAQLKEGGYV